VNGPRDRVFAQRVANFVVFTPVAFVDASRMRSTVASVVSAAVLVASWSALGQQLPPEARAPRGRPKADEEQRANDARGLPPPVTTLFAPAAGVPPVIAPPPNEQPSDYLYPPPPLRRFGLRAELGGAVRFAAAPEGAVVFGAGVAAIRGFYAGRITPALWADLGYLFVGDRNSSHFVSAGIGPAVQSSLVSVGWVPRALVGYNDRGLVFGFRHAAQLALWNSALLLSVGHHATYQANALTHALDVTLTVDAIGVFRRVYSLDEGANR
jgi:hypothetical protein